MYNKFINTIRLLGLSAICSPAISHPGHTSIPHTHGGIEFLLLAIVVAGVIYYFIKN